MVGGHLKREDASRCELRHEVAEQRLVIVDPVETRVRDHQVDGLGGLPPGDVGDHELELTGHRVLSGPFNHFFRAVDAGDSRGGPSVGEGRRESAGTAAEIDRDGWIEIVDYCR